jgi:hypothetical protein
VEAPPEPESKKGTTSRTHPSVEEAEPKFVCVQKVSLMKKILTTSQGFAMWSTAKPGFAALAKGQSVFDRVESSTEEVGKLWFTSC